MSEWLRSGSAKANTPVQFRPASPRRKMYIVKPGKHPVADKIWKEQLGGSMNGARTLGTAQAKHLSKLFEQVGYDMLVTYASDMDFEIPGNVKRIAVMWHANYPWLAGVSLWRKVDAKLGKYQVDYFSNEPHLVELIKEQGGRAYYLPRFIDTKTLPIPKKDKSIPSLWLGNRWASFENQFQRYISSNKTPCWISQGKFGVGKEEKYTINREDTLEILNDSKVVWAIGISQLEAMYLGCKVIPYRDGLLPFYDQNTIKVYLRALLQSI